VHGSLDELACTLGKYSPVETLVFNNCDGFDGSNRAAGKVIRLVEKMGFRHTGAKADAVELCIDKPRAKRSLKRHNVPTPRAQVFTKLGRPFQLNYPAIVKPALEDGSMGITLESVVRTPQQLRRQVAQVLETYGEKAMVEEFILGRELAVSMLGNHPVQILPITEEDYSSITDPLEHLLTYESKWDERSPYYTDIIARIPADLTPAEKTAVESVARDTFHAVGLRDFGRVDIRLEDGIPYVIDINEIPDLSPDSGYWKSAQAAGLTYPQMVEAIVKHALQREGWNP
jgi:D-alanine-D-alanine ligase